MGACWSPPDLHLGHENVIEYAHRPFRDVDTMDDILWDNLTAASAPDKVLLVVGDMAMREGLNAVTWQQIRDLDYRQRPPGDRQPRFDGRRPVARAGV